jgi:tetratricopeptide (TPR) repeat protein
MLNFGYGGSILGVLILIGDIWALLNILQSSVGNDKKLLWVVVVVLLPLIGLILWFFMGLAVESSFISIKDVYFEHRLYYPLAGFIMFLIGLVTYERKRRHERILPIRKTILKNPVAWLLIVFLTLTPAYIGFTIYRNYIYSSSIRLWSDTVKKAPGGDRAHNSLATGYLNAYDEKKLNTEYLDLAEIEYKKAIWMNNANSTAHTNLSKVYLLKEDYDNCITEANKALTYTKSEYAEFNLGSAYQKLGKTDDALKAFLKGYEFNKHSSFIVKAVADTYYDLKDYRNAQRYYKEYLELNNKSKNTNIKKRLEEIESKLPSGKK